MSDIEEVCARLESAAETFSELGEARRKLIGKSLTLELFNEINGEDRGLEALLERDVFIDFTDAVATTQLKQEIFAAIESEEIKVGQEFHAALECFCEDLVKVCSDYDAYSDENLEIRRKLEEKLKNLSKDAKKAFEDNRFDFECFAYTHCLSIIELMNDTVKFFGTDTFNLKRLAELQRKQGSDMTDDEKEFLKTLNKVSDDNLRKPGWDKFDVIWGDRLTNAKASTLGFDTKNVVEVAKALGKAENAFYKCVREIREAICQETSTTDDVSVKNTLFYNAVSRIMWYVRDVASADRALAQQLALICKSVDVSPAPKEPDNTNVDDNGNQQDGGENPPNVEE